MLIKPGVESHTFDPSPSDILKIQNADVFVCIGGHDEAWVDTALDGQDEGPGQVVKLLDCVETLPAEEEEHHHEGEDHDHEGMADEHIWTSPKNASLMAKAICDALVKADPENGETYDANYGKYDAALKKLDQSFRDVVENAPRREVVFGDRFPFRYFAEEYGLEWHAAFSGCAGESEPSAADIAELISRVRTDQIPVVYHIEQGSVRTAQAIAEEASVETEMLHSCHNLTMEEMKSGATYLSLMTKNVEALKKGLQGEA